MSETNSRDRFGSRLGFILLSAGCAIGLGNVWKFPMMVGSMGGGIFVLIYLLCLILIGLPVMTMEFTAGRAAQASPVKIYDKLAPGKKGWKIHAYGSLVANVMLMMFYTTVAGWILRYSLYALTGKFDGKNSDEVTGLFVNMLSDPWMMLLFTAIIAILACFICSLSLGGGLEKITKYMMVALLIIMVTIAVYSFFLDGASDGLTFYLMPDFSAINGKVVANAMNQALFTLSLGIGSMAIFGSYIGKDRSLMGESVSVIILDTFVAIVAGLIIFPACFTYGIEPNSGGGLLFITLPNVFNSLPGGRVWGFLFFLFMVFAAFSTVIAVYENIIACLIELTGIERKKMSWIVCVAMIILNVPMILGNNVWSDFHPFGLAGKDVSDFEDFFVSYIMLPLGSLTYVMFCTKKFGWGWDNFIAEANTGRGIKVQKWMRFYMSYILPIVMFAVFIIGMLSYFGIMQ